MKKISTLFKKDPNDLGRVINELNPENEWVYTENATPTRKYDGTACAVINGELYKRYDAKKGRSIPDGAIPCQIADPITGHHPHWVKCNRDNPADKYHFEAFDAHEYIKDGTYELCGEKVQGNPENILSGHTLYEHGAYKLIIKDMSFEGIKEYLSKNDIEGIVFHGFNGKMCKIRKCDFGLKR